MTDRGDCVNYLVGFRRNSDQRDLNQDRLGLSCSLRWLRYDSDA